MMVRQQAWDLVEFSSFFSQLLFLVGGHDSAEDALACLDLMKMKATEDVKKLRQMALIESRKKE